MECRSGRRRSPFWRPDRPRVFLGSCSKAHDLASAIRWYVESLGFKVIYWKSDFEPGQVILDEIRAASFSCKYAMFLLTPDDQIAGDDPTWVPRDNVVFEAGYFINALGKERTLIIVQEGRRCSRTTAGTSPSALEEG
jgi:predicted nucleotide-binding protein